MLLARNRFSRQRGRDRFGAGAAGSVSVPAQVLLVGGGAHGGHGDGFGGGGGGGAGEVLEATLTLLAGNRLDFTVGAGSSSALEMLLWGGDTILGGLLAEGGGAGANALRADGAQSGGSGGGAARYGSGIMQGGLSIKSPTGYGFVGGGWLGGLDGDAAGGGGAGGVGANAGPAITQSGGQGRISNISGLPKMYAGGGGGGRRIAGGNVSLGGSSIGGHGSTGAGTNPTAGVDGTGSGGGGAGGANGALGGKGGNGEIVIAYPNTYPGLIITGGTWIAEDTRPGYWVYRITAGSGTIALDVNAQVQQVQGAHRYVLLRRSALVPGGEIWIGEVEVFSQGVNIALNKTVTTYNNWGGDWAGPKVVDGIKSGVGGWASVSGVSWLEIDLGGHYLIDQITVHSPFSRTDKNVNASEVNVLFSPTKLSNRTFYQLMTNPEVTHAGTTWFKTTDPAGMLNVFDMAGSQNGPLGKLSGLKPAFAHSEARRLLPGWKGPLARVLIMQSGVEMDLFPSSSTGEIDLGPAIPAFGSRELRLVRTYDQSGWALHKSAFGSTLPEFVNSVGQQSQIGQRPAPKLVSFSQNYMRMPIYPFSGDSSLHVHVVIQNASSGQWSRIIDFGGGETNTIFVTPNSSTGTMFFRIKGGGIAEQGVTSTAVLNNNPNVLGFSHTGSTMAIYQNGVEVSAISGITILPSVLSGTQNDFGKSKYTADAYLNATMGETIAYHQSLTPTQRTNLAKTAEFYGITVT